MWKKWKEHIVETEYDVQINPRNLAYKIYEQDQVKNPGDQRCNLVSRVHWK